jgi:hypothetical protein
VQGEEKLIRFIGNGHIPSTQSLKRPGFIPHHSASSTNGFRFRGADICQFNALTVWQMVAVVYVEEISRHDLLTL